MNLVDGVIDRGLAPDAVLRAGIRRVLARRLAEFDARAQDAWIDALRASPIAIETAAANAQHYEVPAAFYELVLGPHLKYSSGLFAPGVHDLASAEAAMLALTCERARIEPGQEILELGCGWGSLTLWIAATYPDCRVMALSNSASQRRFVEERARARGLANVAVLTDDVSRFVPGRRFDRVVSVEMFEHLRNWPALLERVSHWLHADGRLFMHVFAHRRFAYAFDSARADDWMGRWFFTGGQMPSHDLIRRFQDHLEVEHSWQVPGAHYARTAEAWLANLDARRAEVLAVLRAAAPQAGSARAWLRRWRVFFMACAETFAFDAGREWFVSHHLLRPRAGGSA